MIVEKATALERDYLRSVRSFVYALWTGQYDIFTFIDGMIDNVARHIRGAWYEGAAKCGVKPDELTGEEIAAMETLIASQYAYLLGFATDIDNGSRTNRGKLTPFYQRAELWANRYAEARDQAMQMACADQKLEWVWNPLKEHCTDCVNLNGRVYRASVWKKYDIRPKMNRLECRGYQCGCVFAVTDKPVTPGRPPAV